MGRASRADAARHRDEIVDAASRLFRARGVGAVSVPEVMAAAGLTHGGFYRHFPSKDALAAGAVEHAFAFVTDRIRRLHARCGGDPTATRARFVDGYLSPAHRDGPDRGCPSAALATEIAHAAPDSTLRGAYGEALRRYVTTWAELLESGADPDERERAALLDLSTMVGALVLARASAGDELSERILGVARDGLAR